MLDYSKGAMAHGNHFFFSSTVFFPAKTARATKLNWAPDIGETEGELGFLVSFRLEVVAKNPLNFTRKNITNFSVIFEAKNKGPSCEEGDRSDRSTGVSLGATLTDGSTQWPWQWWEQNAEPIGLKNYTFQAWEVFLVADSQVDWLRSLTVFGHSLISWEFVNVSMFWGLFSYHGRTVPTFVGLWVEIKTLKIHRSWMVAGFIRHERMVLSNWTCPRICHNQPKKMYGQKSQKHAMDNEINTPCKTPTTNQLRTSSSNCLFCLEDQWLRPWMKLKCSITKSQQLGGDF